MARLIAKTRGAFGVVASLSLFLTHFTAWILAGVPATYRAMQENPLLVAQTGHRAVGGARWGAAGC